jgi:putative membrane protein
MAASAPDEGASCGLPATELAATTDVLGTEAHASCMVTAYWHMHDTGAGWWVLMTLGWLAVVALAVWAVGSLARGRDGEREAPSAREVLDRRLAEGDITVEEYQRLRDAMAPLTAPAASHR